MQLPTRKTIEKAKQYRSVMTFSMLGLDTFKVYADGRIELLNPGIDKHDALAAMIAFMNMAISKAQTDASTMN